MIVLFTDYGVGGFYTGQLEVVLQVRAPGVPVINLCADVPRQNPKAASYLLAALRGSLPQPAVWLCVVDPGVGTWSDAPAIFELDGRWFVGPDNGLFDIVARRAHQRSSYCIQWRPGQLSQSFHGRDLYAPVAAELALGRMPDVEPRGWRPRYDWPDDLNEVIYLDNFGNAVTGLRAASLNTGSRLVINGQSLNYAMTFGEVPEGCAFWYENSSGLVEIAVNQGSAEEKLSLMVGSTFVFKVNS